MMVARPRAVPIPLPLIAFGPTRLNLPYRSISINLMTMALALEGAGASDDVHRCILKHVWYNKESYHASSNVYLIQLRYTPVASSHRNVLQ
jgi:hypothetical protein